MDQQVISRMVLKGLSGKGHVNTNIAFGGSGCGASLGGVLGSQAGLWLCHCVETATGKRSGKARASVQKGQEETVGRAPGGTSPLGGSAGSGLAGASFGASFGASLPLGAFLAAVTQMLRLQHPWCSPRPSQSLDPDLLPQNRGPDPGSRPPFQA